MNDTWDLSILYKDFDDPAFTGDMAALDQAIAAVNALAGEAAGMEHSQLVHRFLQVQERVEELANKLFIFCSLRCSANTADTKANSLGDQLSAKLSGCAAANASLRRTVAELEDLDARWSITVGSPTCPPSAIWPTIPIPPSARAPMRRSWRAMTRSRIP